MSLTPHQGGPIRQAKAPKIDGNLSPPTKVAQSARTRLLGSLPNSLEDLQQLGHT
ncbi:hypothetical protein [Corynebacterium auriscanis]|uniref:hypothetical protein n=1 Tax=Corynebacterium auriscanis TaxID=99807 RepID=UPI003CFA079D